jgi:hypothetical protein
VSTETAEAAPPVGVGVGGGWIRREPVRAAAVALIVLGVAWRASITFRGFLAVDDFPLIARADAAQGPGFLLELYNNHFMPAGHLLIWLTDRLTGYDYWPYATLLIVGQAVVSVAFYRLLVLMLPVSWTLLVPLCLFLFSPLTLEVSAWWAVGVNMLPMQLAMVLAAGALVRYTRTGRRRHLATLGLSVVLGLLFFEKSLLIVAFLFLLAVLLYTDGGPVAGVLVAIRRWWPAWLVLTGISVAFLVGYLSASTSSLRRPASADEVAAFLVQLAGHTVMPGLVGGPWSWLDGADGAALTAPGRTARWVAAGLVLAFVAFTIWLRRSAVRAWLLLLVYLALVAGLLAATRLGSAYSGVAGAVPRYVSDVVVVAAVCVGVALCGLRRAEPRDRSADRGDTVLARPVAVPARAHAFGAALAAGVVLLVASSLWSGTGFADDWAVKAGRDYLRNARADLAAAPPGTVFMDQPVPESVVPALSAPWNAQSRFFAPLDPGPVFVTKARSLSVFAADGHIRPAWVTGVTAAPGPEPGCGYKLTGGGMKRIPLVASVTNYWQAVRVAYLSDRDTTATLRLVNGETVGFDVQRGLNAVFLLVRGGGAELELAVADPSATLCTDEIAIGALVPAPTG